MTPEPTPEPSVLADICREYGDAEEARLYGREPIVGVSEAMIDAAMRADGFGYAAISDTLPDLVAQTREWYRRILSAALRAVPVEGRPLAAAITDHPVSVEDAVKLLREAEQELSGGEGNHEILGAECGVMADRLAALATPAPKPAECRLSDGSVVTVDKSGWFQRKTRSGDLVTEADIATRVLLEDVDCGADFDALKAFAATRTEGQ